jgi:hypothetical protein
MSLIFGEVAGHPRSASKQNVNDLIRKREVVWFEHFVRGTGPEPFEGVTAFTQTCPATEPGGGPFKSRNWARIAPGEVRLTTKGSRTITAGSGDPAIAAAFDPVTGGGSCVQTSSAEEPGTATYELDPAPADGFTLLGSPTVIARFALTGNTSQVAARLLDVAPDGQQTLVARGLWRPKAGTKRQVFQLHANGWHFAEGHVAKLELLPADNGSGPLGGYGRTSNDQQDVEVKELQLRLPVVEKPGSLEGLVRAHAPRLVPRNQELARDFRRDPRAKLTRGELELTGHTLRAEVKCPGQFTTCQKGEVELVGEVGRGSLCLMTGNFSLRGGQKETVELRASRCLLAYMRDHERLRVTAYVTSAETTGRAVQSRKIVG